jgi:hypothetical protein
VCIFSITLLSGLMAVQAQLPAGKSRPLTVPDGYLATPMGYFHPSCVKQVANGDILHPDELAIEHIDGSFDAMTACAYPHFSARGEMAPAVSSADAKGGEPPYIGHSWMEAVQIETGSSYGEITSEFKVPDAPTSHDGQTIYFFPGMQDTNDVATIIQPVLGWNAYYTIEWGIASWNCCAKGTTYYSTPEPTEPGHVIYGEMKNTCSAGTLSCSKWDITTKDLTSGAHTELKNSSSQHQTFNWGFANVLEVYSVSTCSDYPAGGKLEAYDVTVYNDKFEKITPSWSLWQLWSGLSPQCGYGASWTKSEATIKY